MTDKLITEPRRLGRVALTPGEPRIFAWSMKLSAREFERAESLPGSSRANRLVMLMNAREALRELVEVCRNPRYSSYEFGAAVDRAREVLGETEEAR